MSGNTSAPARITSKDQHNILIRVCGIGINEARTIMSTIKSFTMAAMIMTETLARDLDELNKVHCGGWWRMVQGSRGHSGQAWQGCHGPCSHGERTSGCSGCVFGLSCYGVVDNCLQVAKLLEIVSRVRKAPCSTSEGRRYPR